MSEEADADMSLWTNVSFTEEEYNEFPELPAYNHSVNFTVFSEWVINQQNTHGPSSEKLHYLDSAGLLALCTLLLLIIITIWVFRYKKFRYVQVSGLAILYGAFVGIIVHLQPAELEGLVTFDPEVFFYVLLPPILLHAGMTMDSILFFRYIGPILTFSFLGTALAAIVTGILQFLTSHLPFITTLSIKESLLFGALISATDTVTVLTIFKEVEVEPALYALVFGESAINDAIAITLFNVIESYNGVGNAVLTSLGVFFLSILLAEVTHLSGIVAILTCGIVQGHYTLYNVSQKSREMIASLLELLSFFAENFIFGYLGVSLFTYPGLVWEPLSLIFGLVNCLIGRATGVFVISSFLNKIRSERNQIPLRQQIMLWFSGLRGAVAFALAIENSQTKESRIILSTTLFVVITTVYVCGSLAIPVAEYLQVTLKSREKAEIALTSEGFEVPIGEDEVDMSDIPRASAVFSDDEAPTGLGRFAYARAVVNNRVEEFFYNIGYNYLTPFFIRQPTASGNAYARMNNTEENQFEATDMPAAGDEIELSINSTSSVFG
eukprot:CFRG1798T1